jgi:hypothetical protein
MTKIQTVVSVLVLLCGITHAEDADSQQGTNRTDQAVEPAAMSAEEAAEEALDGLKAHHRLETFALLADASDREEIDREYVKRLEELRDGFAEKADFLAYAAAKEERDRFLRENAMLVRLPAEYPLDIQVAHAEFLPRMRSAERARTARLLEANVTYRDELVRHLEELLKTRVATVAIGRATAELRAVDAAMTALREQIEELSPE